ncbi:MAG: hypothetical protein JWP97_3429 [Labilithrix sp.]|nr:hypothetical protein [Labilithrix sp.]
MIPRSKVPELIPLLLSDSLTSSGFRHGFTTRAGGVSEAPFEHLDFALLRDPPRLAENQRRLAETVGYDAARLYQTVQVHGRVVRRAEGTPADLVTAEADALVAAAGSGAAVGIRVADCVPVLLADPRSGRVAAAHAGWRGVVADVLGAALADLAPEDPSAVIAAIGPCIGPCCFEVSDDVGEQIARATSDAAIARRDPARGKAFVDLRRAVRAQLGAHGLRDAHVEDVGACTRCDAERFYSYRRDGDASGRLLAVIAAR